MARSRRKGGLLAVARINLQLSALRAAQRRRRLLLGGGFKPALSVPLAFAEENWDGYTLRQIIPANVLSTSGTALRLGIASAVSGATNVVAMYVGHAGAGYDYESAPMPVTVEGATSFTVPQASGRLMTDPVEMTVDRTKRLIYSVFFDQQSRVPFQWFVGDEFDSGYLVGNSAAGQEAPDGYTSQGTKMTMVDLIEVRK